MTFWRGNGQIKESKLNAKRKKKKKTKIKYQMDSFVHNEI